MSLVLLGNPIWKWLLALGLIALVFFVRRLLSNFVLACLRKFLHAESTLARMLEQKLLPVLSRFLLYLAWVFVSESLLLFSDSLGTALWRLNRSLLVVLLLSAVAKVFLTVELEERAYQSKCLGNYNRSTLTFMRKGLLALLIVFAVLKILQLYNVNVGGFMAGLGLSGLAISLAAKESLSNLIAGLLIMSDGSFDIGDEIVALDIKGTVEAIGLRSSKVRAYDQSLIIVPNSQLANNMLCNISKAKMRRISLNLVLPVKTTKADLLSLRHEITAYFLEREQVIQDLITITIDSIQGDGLHLNVRFFVREASFACWQAEKEAFLFFTWNLLQRYNLNKHEAIMRIVEGESSITSKANDDTILT